MYFPSNSLKTEEDVFFSSNQVICCWKGLPLNLDHCFQHFLFFPSHFLHITKVDLSRRWPDGKPALFSGSGNCGPWAKQSPKSLQFLLLNSLIMSCHGRKQRCFTVYTHTASLNFPEELAVKSGGNSFGLKSVVISCRHSFDPVTSNGKNSQLCLFLICDLLFGGPPSLS